ncbi:MAG TPA: hypothetical protein VF376_05165 [Thermoanaerobaculia bacterium]
MRITTDFARGICVGVGLASVAAVAALRGFPSHRLWCAERVVPGDRKALERAVRLAQESPEYLDACRAAGM